MSTDHDSTDARKRVDAAVDAVARQQYGLIRMDQAAAAGLSRHAIRHLVARGRWVRVLPRVYSPTTGEISAERRRVAAVLTQRPLAAIGEARAPLTALYGVSALLHWGIRVDHPSAKIVHLLVPYARTPSSPSGVLIHRSRAFDEGDVQIRRAVPVTRIERALADAAAQIRGYIDFVAVVAAAVQDGRTTIARLGLEADARGPFRGSAHLVRALRAVDRGDRSIAEWALAELISRAGVPAPRRGVVLATRIGGVIPDFLWRDLGLYAEVDGQEWHLSPEDWEHDLDRQNALAELGLTPLRYSARSVLREGGRVIAALRAEVDRRSRLAG